MIIKSGRNNLLKFTCVIIFGSTATNGDWIHADYAGYKQLTWHRENNTL